MAKFPKISRDDVLNAFAMDHEPGNNALGRYLTDYPQFSAALIDLSRELSREIDESLPLTVDELAAVGSKLDRIHEAAVSLQMLEAAAPKVFAEAAKTLGLPLQVGVAIRERRIDVETLPARVLELLAQTLQAPVAALRSFLLMPAQVSSLRTNKSNDKPASAEKVAMEKLLRDAGMDEQRISALLSGDE